MVNIIKLPNFKMAIKRPFLNYFLPNVNQSLADIAEHICQIKKRFGGFFSETR